MIFFFFVVYLKVFRMEQKVLNKSQCLFYWPMLIFMLSGNDGKSSYEAENWDCAETSCSRKRVQGELYSSQVLGCRTRFEI